MRTVTRQVMYALCYVLCAKQKKTKGKIYVGIDGEILALIQ